MNIQIKSLGKIFDSVRSKLPSIRIKATEYGYSNARVRGMKGQLIKNNMINELLQVDTVEGMVEVLQRSGYKNELSAAALVRSGPDIIDLAVSKNFSAVIRKLLKISPKIDQKSIHALVTKWKIINLKIIMQAKRIGKNFEEIEPQLMIIEPQDKIDLQRILKADDKNLIKEIKRSEIGKQIMPEEDLWQTFEKIFSSNKSFFDSEKKLDIFSYLITDRLLSKSGSQKDLERIRKILKLEINSKNIMIIARMKKMGMSLDKIEEEIIKGGSLRKKEIHKIKEAKNIKEINTVIKDVFPDIAINEDNNLVDLEIALEKAVAAKKVAAFEKEVVSVGVILGFLFLKEQEANNFRKIAKAKGFGIPVSEVRQMII